MTSVALLSLVIVGCAMEDGSRGMPDTMNRAELTGPAKPPVAATPARSQAKGKRSSRNATRPTRQPAAAARDRTAAATPPAPAPAAAGAVAPAGEVAPAVTAAASATEMPPMPATDLAPMPATDLAPMPATDLAPIPATDLAPIPATDLAPIPATASTAGGPESAEGYGGGHGPQEPDGMAVALASPATMTLAPEPSAGPEPRPAPVSVVGLDERQVAGLLGRPAAERTRSLGKVWHYSVDGCRLDVHLFPDLKTGSYRTLDYRMASSDGAAPDRCLGRLIEGRR